MTSSTKHDQGNSNIYLVGMMGTGKSTIGKILATRLRMDFIDSDQSIEKSSGLSVTEIFAKHGEETFRNLEQEFVDNGHPIENQIVACGGGLCIPAGMMELLKSKGKVICLWASSETLLERTGADQARPLLQVSDPLEQIEKLITERGNRYREADHIINTDKLTTDEVVHAISTVLHTDR